MASHVPRRAYESKEFLSSAEGRSIRILSEYFEPEQRLRQKQIWHTVVFFGSARIKDCETANRELNDLIERNADQTLIDHARRAVLMSRYYEDARTLSKLVTEWSLTLPREERMFVCSGGGGGIMEAANRGASEAGGKTVAFNIQLPFEQMANPYVQSDLTFDFHYFFMRKFWFVHRAKAIIVFPGGFGTLDELMESLTLTQTGRVDKHMPIVIYGREFWEDLINLDRLSYWGMISPEDRDLFTFVDTPEEALTQIKEAFTYRGE